MDDGYPPEKTPSKERQTCGRRQDGHGPGGHGLRDLLQGARNQHRRKEGRKGLNLQEKDGQLLCEMDMFFI